MATAIKQRPIEFEISCENCQHIIWIYQEQLKLSHNMIFCCLCQHITKVDMLSKPISTENIVEDDLDFAREILKNQGFKKNEIEEMMAMALTQDCNNRETFVKACLSCYVPSV